MKTSTKTLRVQMQLKHSGRSSGFRLAAICLGATTAVVACAGVLFAGSPYDVPVQGVQMPIAANQFLTPAAPHPVCGIDCYGTNRCRCADGGTARWEDARFIAWQHYAQGEYVGAARLEHVAEYRLRADDQMEMLFRLTREESARPYKLNVGDEVKVESFTDAELNRTLLIQPDGTITLRLLGQVHATGRTVVQLRDDLEDRYKKFYKVPSITITPTKVDTKIDDLRAVIDRRQGVGGQTLPVRVTPEGTIALPALGSVKVQNLTLDELRHELNERFHEKFEGIEIVPVLVQRAPRFVYVLGEVKAPGRYELVAPTTILQSIALAGSWNVGANIAQVVVFRRGDDWRLMATMVDIQGALRGKSPCPRGEIWIADSDVIIVPKSRILEADDFINLVFTRGVYGVFPMENTITFAKLKTI